MSLQKILSQSLYAPALAALLFSIPRADAQSFIPYGSDAQTLHLWHLNESTATAASPAVDSIPGSNNLPLQGLLGGATLGTASLAGFSTALNTYGSGGTGGILLAASALANGSGDDVAFSFADPTTGAFTLEALVKFNAAFNPMTATSTDRNMEVISMDNDSSGRNFLFRLVSRSTSTASARLQFINLRNTQTIEVVLPSSGANVPDNTSWFHVAVAYDPAASPNLTFYWTKMTAGVTAANVAGTGAMSQPLLTSTGDFAIGNEARSTGGETEAFPGLIDEVRISSVARAANAMLPSNYDGDGNGLPDAWELAYFPAAGVNPSADPDGDGVTNLQEYLDGANPVLPDAAAPSITSALTANGSSGAAFTYHITATNSPASFSATGLPGGLSVDTATGAITGTPTAAGSFAVTLGATNVRGTGTATLALAVADLPPSAPDHFSAAVNWISGKPAAVLAWQPGAGGGTVGGYVLERRIAGTGSYARLVGLNAAATTFTDRWIQPDTAYEYRLSAFNNTTTSIYSTASLPASAAVPLGYLGWAHARWLATGNTLAAGSQWNDVDATGTSNGLNYAFSGDPLTADAPGFLSLTPGAGSTVTISANRFAPRADVHYAILGSANLSQWQSYLDDSAPVFSQLSTGSGPLPLFDADAGTAPGFFVRWQVSPNADAIPAPEDLLVNNLSGSSGAALTQGTPTFSWEVGSSTQTGYQIIVSTSESAAAAGTGTVWDSGAVASSESTNVAYAGTALQSNTTYYWTVRTLNAAGEVSSYAPVQNFQTGTLTSTYQTDRPLVVQEAVAPVQVVQKSTGYYFIDFGKDAFGTVTLFFQNPEAGRVVTVHLAERLSAPATVDRTASPGSNSNYVRYQKQTITMVAGQQTYKVTPTWTALYSGWVAPPTYIGQVAPFRYVELENVPEPFTASQITQLATHVPFDDSASFFTSSNDTLNRVWELCKHTIKATTFLGIYVDGDRERIPYEADAYIAQLGHYSVDREYTTARYTHEYLLTHSTWPTEWLQHSIFMAWMDYLYTGDNRSLAANYTTLQSKLLLDRRRTDGLFRGTTATGSGSQPTDIVDWPAGERDGYEITLPVKTVLAAFHYQTLVLMQQIATVLGKTADATNYASQAAVTKAAINSKFWSASKNAYIDGATASDSNSASITSTSTHVSLHGNMFPLAFDIVPDDRKAAVVSFIKSRGMACSVYGAQYLLEALYKAGEGDYALSLLTSTTGIRNWINMLNVGSTMTMEAWDASLKSNTTWNHAWGAAPANIIPRYLMGVRPLEPGFKKILIQPQPGSLAYADIQVPTPRGPVRVTVNDNRSASFSLTTEIPANANAKVGLPALGSASTTAWMDGQAVTGTLEGSTLWIDDVSPGAHLFERRP